jgi:SAM-dependent methyltransferase
MPTPNFTRIAQKETRFSKEIWGWFFDDAVPRAVKRSYSPRPEWAGKPFSEKDLKFFLKGLHELHQRFTSERPLNRDAPVKPYFRHAKFRSSYLLYFLPIHASKFFVLFDRHPAAIEAMKTDWKRKKVLRIADLGSGPGTASIALLLYLLEHDPEAFDFGPVELHWFDREKAVFGDGRKLIEALEEKFESVRGRVSLTTYPVNIARSLDTLKTLDWNLILSGNVLNELLQRDRDFALRMFRMIYPRVQGGGLVFVEPATKPASQQISKLRDLMLATELLPKQRGIWGPCIHHQPCPLKESRDWCHQAIPTTFRYRWLSAITRSLETEMKMTKFSYLWIASSTHPTPRPLERDRRVVSGRLKGKTGNFDVQLCEPYQIKRLPVGRKQEIHRGDLVRFAGSPPKRQED